jgi:hypothetical protein
MAFGTYYNWEYANKHGFMSWLTLGQIVPTAKAFVWPYFVFFAPKPTSWSDVEKQNAMHFHLSMNASRAATKLTNLGSAYSTIPQSEIVEMQRLMKIALQEAQLVQDVILDKAFPGMSKPFREKYQRSLELKLRAAEEDYLSAVPYEIKGTTLYNEWVDWINAHNSEIQIPR